MTNVKNIRIGDKDVYLVMKGGQAIWPERASLVQDFIANAKSEGYTVDEPLLYKSFQTLHPILKRDFSEALILGAYKEGSIAAMKNDGSIVNYPFQRNSTKTYWDKDGKMKVAEPNVPTLDYDPVTGECKGYGFNRALTNLWTESTMDNMALINKLIRGSTNFNLGEPLDTGLIFEGYSGVNSDGYTSTAKWVREVSKTYTLLFYVQRSDMQEFKLETSRMTIRIGDRGYNNDSNVGIDKKYIGNGVWRYKIVNSSGILDNRSAINRTIDSTQTHDVTLTGYNIFEGDVSIDEPYIPTNGSIVTTVGDAYNRATNIFTGQSEASFYIDSEFLMTTTLLNKAIIGGTNNATSIYWVNGTAIRSGFMGASSDVSSGAGFVIVGENKIKSAISYNEDELRTKASHNGVYVENLTGTGYTASSYNNPVPRFFALNDKIPVFYLKALVFVFRELSQEEQLEITS